MKHLKHLLISLILITSACTAAETRNDEGDLVNTQWKLVSFGEPGSEKPVIEGSPITIEFTEGGQAGGSAGCNSYGGTYTVQDDMLQFGEIVSTLMACADQAVMEQEQQYLQALNTAGQFTVINDTLTIWYEDDKGVLNFERASAAMLVNFTLRST
jgi:heat shock protein HslJ